MEKPKTLIQQWPGGVSTLAGGTRTAIKVNRPWQKQLDIDPTTCPFEPARLEAEQRQVIGRSLDGDWINLENRFTPYVDHTLVTPVTCADWPDARVRLLGGEEGVWTGLDLSYQTIVNKPTRRFKLITINIGWSGGQNVGHIHWHIYSLPVEAMVFHPDQIALSLKQSKNPITLFDQDGLRVAVGGHRAGQCFILPNGNVAVENLAAVIHRIVTLYAEKFRSKVGEQLAPDFTIELVYDWGKFIYGAYIPVLNNWGAGEYLALLGQQAITLPWRHAQTVAYLCGEIVL